MGAYYLYPSGRLRFEYFGAERSELSFVIQARLLSDQKIAEYLKLAPEFSEWLMMRMAKLAKTCRKIRDQLLERLGDPEFVTPEQLVEASSASDDPRYVAAEKVAARELNERLSPEQHEKLAEAIGIRMTTLLGLPWALSHGRLGKILKVRPEQKKALREAAKESAAELKKKSDDLESLAIRMLKEQLPDPMLEGLSLRFISDDSCGYPECILPAQAFSKSHPTPYSIAKMRNERG